MSLVELFDKGVFLHLNRVALGSDRLVVLPTVERPA